MAANRLTTSSSRMERGATCKNCRSNAMTVVAPTDYQTVFLEDYLSSQDVSEFELMLEGVTKSNWSTFEIEGIPIGRYSAYISLLQHKLLDVTQSESSWSEYKAELFNSLVTFRAVSRILSDVNPSHSVVYNPLYPANRIFSVLSENHGSKLIGISAGAYVPSRYESVALYPHVSSSQTLTESQVIAEELKDELTVREIQLVSLYLRSLITASDPWIYSSRMSSRDDSVTRQKLGILEGTPIATVLLSSPDETRASVVVGAEHARRGNKSQPDISAFVEMVKTAASMRPEIHFIFRVHPRMFPNKRESVVSSDVVQILKELEDLPVNCTVNTPNQEVSLYELIAISDMALNQSSSAGLEFLSLGVPVINCDPETQGIYPPEFGLQVSMGDHQALVAALDQAIHIGSSLDFSIQAFRWYGVTLLRALLPLSDTYEKIQENFALETNAFDSELNKPKTAILLRLVPERIREKGAKWIDRWERRREVPDPTEDHEWFPEFLERILSMSEGPIWEPLLVRRGQQTNGVETDEIRREVNEIRRHIGATYLD
jgi:hypothetical protein